MLPSQCALLYEQRAGARTTPDFSELNKLEKSELTPVVLLRVRVLASKMGI